jgi:Protein of unknown function (DUF2628)
MKLYNVLAPPAAAGSAGPQPEAFVFVKEGFCWPALYLAPFWLLWRRLWLVFALYVVAVIAIAMLAEQLPGVVIWFVFVLFGFLVALEANNLRRWTLERRGYRFVGVASGGNAREAEFRFFARWVGSKPEPPKPEAPKPKPSLPAPATQIVGLFPTPGARS